MERRSRKTGLLALLAAAALLGGAAWLLLREDGGGGGGHGGPDVASPLDGPPAGSTAGEGNGREDGLSPSLPAAGLVSGILILPRAEGRPPVEARLTVLREGAAVAEATAGPGAFSLAYDRAPGDPGPFRLRAAAAGRTPVHVDLPAPATDVGEIRLHAGIVYSGRAVDERGIPQQGVTFHLLVDGGEAAASEPSSPDGGFRIPVPPGTRLQGFFQEEDSAWGGPPSLEPRAPGRLFVASPARAEGLTGVHDLVLEERPVGIRLRFIDGPTGIPVAGAGVSLWRSPDVFALGPPSPEDRGATDADGIYAPRWPLALTWASIRVALPGGRILWTLLDRAYAEGTEPREFVLPAEPLRLRAVCLRGKGEEPVAGAFVVLVTNAATSFWGTSGAEGTLSFEFFESDTFDPGALAVSAWTAAWTDGDRGLRLEAGGSARMGQADFRELSYTIDSPVPLPVRLGSEEALGIWIAIRGEGAGTGARPAMVTANPPGYDPTKDGWRFLISSFKGPAPGKDGATLWWAYDYTREIFRTKPGPFGGLGPETPLTAQMRTVGGPFVDAAVTVASLAAARCPPPPPLSPPPPPAAMRRPGGGGPGAAPPRPGALVAVLRADQPKPWPARETERLAADGEGRAVLQTLDPAGGGAVLAWDPADGACGALEGGTEAAPEAAWTVKVEPPREFRLRLRTADGSALASAFVSLAPRSGMLPPVQVSFRDGPEGSAPGVALAGYDVYVYARDARGRTHIFRGAAAAVSGTEIVLGEATPASGR